MTGCGDPECRCCGPARSRVQELEGELEEAKTRGCGCRFDETGSYLQHTCQFHRIHSRKAELEETERERRELESHLARLEEAANEAFGILNARTDLDDSAARHQAKRRLRRALTHSPPPSDLPAEAKRMRDHAIEADGAIQPVIGLMRFARGQGKEIDEFHLSHLETARPSVDDWRDTRPGPPCRDAGEVRLMLRIIDHLFWNAARRWWGCS